MQTLPELQSQQPAQDQKTQQRKRRRVWPWIVLGIVILLPLLFFGWTGIYHIPVVSSLFGSATPKTLGVEPSAEALASAIADNPMSVTAEPGTFRWSQNKTFSGSVPINDEHTSAEVTSFIDYYHGDTGHVRDIHVRFHDGGMEVSGFVVPYINAPAYADVGVTVTSPTSIALDVRKVKVGNLTIPSGYYDEIQDAATRIINRELANAPGFSIESLEYNDGSVVFKGTLPKNVSLSEGERTLDEILQ